MEPVSLAQLIDAFVNFPRSNSLPATALSRLQFWRDVLGARPVAAIHADEVDAALIRLQARGCLRPRKNHATEAKGKPLAPATVNRYVSTLAGLFKHARRLRIVPRTHTSPLAGLERAPEPIDPNRYFSEPEVARLVAAARVVDRKWGRLVALIQLGFVTGLRRGNLLALRWADVDLEHLTVSVGRTKNGSAHVAPITEAVAKELKRLPRPDSPDELVFLGTKGRPHGFRKLWLRACAEAGLAGKNFHQLRHGTATALARANINQPAIMAALGHRTLAASARYLHHNIGDRRAVIEKVFGT